MSAGDVDLHAVQSAIASANNSDKLNCSSQASNVPMSFDRAIATTAALDVNSEAANSGDQAQFHDFISHDGDSMLFTDHNFYSDDFWPSHNQNDGAVIINTQHMGTMSFVNDNDADQRSRYINSCYGPQDNLIVADNSNTSNPSKGGESNGMKNASINSHTPSGINLSTPTYTSFSRPPSPSSLIKLSDITIREAEAAEIKERIKEGNQYMTDLRRKPINGRREENGSELSITNMQRIWMENYQQVSDPQLDSNAHRDLLEKDRLGLSRSTTLSSPNVMATYSQLRAEDDGVVAGQLWRAPGHADRLGGSNLDDLGVSRMQEGSPVNHRLLRANAKSYTYLMEEPDQRSPRENTICTYLDLQRGSYHQPHEVLGTNIESKMDAVDENAAYDYMNVKERQPASSTAEVMAALTQITENMNMAAAAAAAAAMSNPLIHEEEEIAGEDFDIDEDLERALFGSCRDGAGAGAGAGGGAAAAAYLSCDEFRMYEFKIRGCMREKSHDWTQCPFAHPGEKARRRDPRLHTYAATPCPDFRKSSCKRGDDCELSHGVFECWLHPSRYRTQLCKDGKQCKRKVCFFAHSPSQLRIFCSNTGTNSASSTSSSSSLCSSSSSSSSSSVQLQQQFPVSQNIPSFCGNQYGKDLLRDDDLHRVANQHLERSSNLLYDGSPVRIAMDSSEFIDGLPNYYHNMFLTKYHDPALSLATATTRQLHQYLQQHRHNPATSTKPSSCMIPAGLGCGGEKNYIAAASRQHKYLNRDQTLDYSGVPFGLMPANLSAGLYAPQPQYIHGQELRPPVLCPHELISPDHSLKLYNVTTRNPSRTHTPIQSYSRSSSGIADIHHNSIRNATPNSSHGVIRPGASNHCHMYLAGRSSSGHCAFNNSTANICSQSMNPAYSHDIRQLYKPYNNQYGLSTDSTLITPQQMDMFQFRRHEMRIPVENSSDISHGIPITNMKRPYLPDTSRNTSDGLTVIPGGVAANTSHMQCHANNIRRFSCSGKDDGDPYLHHPLVNPAMNSCSQDKSSQYIPSPFRRCSGDDNNSASPPSHHHQHGHQSLEYNSSAAPHSLVQVPTSHHINFAMGVSDEGQNLALQQRNYHMISTAKTTRALDHPQYLQQQAPPAMEADKMIMNRDETAVRQVGDEKDYNSGACGDNNSQLLSHLEASLHEMEIRTMDYLQQKRKLITTSGLQVESDVLDPWRPSELNLSYSPWNPLNHMSTARSDLQHLVAPGSNGQIMNHHHHGADEICNKIVGAGGSDHQTLSQDQKHLSIMNNAIISHDWVNELVK